jgi:hypothetical protein
MFSLILGVILCVTFLSGCGGDAPITGKVIGKNICQHWNYSHHQVAVASVEDSQGRSWMYTFDVSFAYYCDLKIGHTYKFSFQQGFWNADCYRVILVEEVGVPKVELIKV